MEELVDLNNTGLSRKSEHAFILVFRNAENHRPIPMGSFTRGLTDS